MTICRDCIFWEKEKVENISCYEVGRCKKILEHIEVDVSSGWDGHTVNWVETEPEFGCIAGEEDQGTQSRKDFDRALGA